MYEPGMFEPDRGNLGRLGLGRRGLRVASGALLALIVATAVTGCGTSVATSLPDAAQKNVVPEGGRKPLTAAEQKQAIDAMVAKRDAQNKDQSK